MTTKTSSSKAEETGLAYFMSLSYPMELHEDEDGYTAAYPDLPGCISYGDSPDDAVKRLKVTKKLWIEGKLEAGFHIPLPSQPNEFSGKFVLRIPRDLHRALHTEAAAQGVSLNQYLAYVLSKRQKNNEVETAAIVAGITASLGEILVNQKFQYAHRSSNWAGQLLWEGMKPNFANVAFLALPSTSFDCVLKDPGYQGKAAYADPHVHSHLHGRTVDER